MEGINNDTDSIGIDEDPRKSANRGYFQKFYARNSKSELFKLRKSLANKKFREKKKKAQAAAQLVSSGGYKSRDGLLKHVRKLEAKLPQNEFRARQVAQELSNRHPMPLSNINDKIKTPKPLTEDEKKVLEFYQSEENIVILPGKRDFIVRRDENKNKVRLQKHVLKESKDNAYKKFKVCHKLQVKIF